MSIDHHLLFKTLADPTRRALFQLLCGEGELSVGVLTARTKISQPAVSKHLGLLKQAGLVRVRQKGRQNFYSAQPAALIGLVDWTAQLGGFWRSQMNRFEEVVASLEVDPSSPSVSAGKEGEKP